MNNVANTLIALLAGLLFGLGLAISGMMNPARVLGFLDLAGNWDPSLAFVMAGAVAASALGYALRARLARPQFAEKFQVPTSRVIDGKLIAGSALFGLGWGLVGLCPGPAIAALPLALPKILVFVAAMIAGMAACRFLFEDRAAVPAQ